MAIINIEAENVRLWINEHKREDGSTWNTYSISTSSKDKDGNYVNKGIEVRMTREVQLPEDLANGELVTIRGSLSNRQFTGKDGEKRTEHMIWAQEVDLERWSQPKPSEPADNFSAAADEIPF